MTSTLLVLLLSQVEGPDNPPDGAMEPALSASSAGRPHSLARMEATGVALLPGGALGGAEVRWRLLGGRPYAPGTGGTPLFSIGVGAVRPGAFASVCLGVDDAR